MSRDVRAELAEIKRRLGPYAALQPSEPHRLADAEIARRVQSLVEIVDHLAEEVEILAQATSAIGVDDTRARRR